MSPSVKRRQAETVRRRFSDRIADVGFNRTRPTFWTHRDAFVIQFVHLHLLTFTSAFRVHFGLRVLNDTFPAAELNGPMSADGWAVAARKYQFDFANTPESIERCAHDLASFIVDVGLPWFKRFESPAAVLAVDGPLSEESRARLRLALDGHEDRAAIEKSGAMLGLES